MKEILATVLSILFCISCAAIDKHAVVLSRLDDEYDKTHPVRLVIKNITSTRVRVYANLELWDEQDGWTSWPFRVEDGRLGAISEIYYLNPRESTAIAFDITQTEWPPIPAGEQEVKVEQAKLRFRVVVLVENKDEQKEELFTEPFVVTHPY